MTSRTIKPFTTSTTFDYFQKLRSNIISEIENLDNNVVLATPVAELERRFTERVTIEPLVFYRDRAEIEITERADVDVSGRLDYFVMPGEKSTVPGTTAWVAVPYDGASQLWELRPSSFTSGGQPSIWIRPGSISFPFKFIDNEQNSELMGKLLEKNLRLLAETVERLNHDVEIHNRQAPPKIVDAITRKRASAENALGVLKALRIPISAKDRPPVYAIPLKRRPAPVHNSAPVAKFKPEPVIDAEVYEHILGVVKSLAMVIERTPSVFESLTEEQIRTHFLLHLNGHYEGMATGETFNFEGKTDILIRYEGRNAFIAECKFWKGAKGFDETIDQLLRYLSWRDSKAALLIFNPMGDSTAIKETMHEMMIARKEHRRTCAEAGSGDRRYVFVKENDQAREITLTTILFDVPRKSKTTQGVATKGKRRVSK